MRILGLSFGYHDSAAALVIDGIVAAAQEERFSRVKHDHTFPGQAVAFCLEQAGITAADLDVVAYHERPHRKFNRIIEAAARSPRGGAKYLRSVLPRWFVEEKFDVARVISRRLGVPEGVVRMVEHHQSHAAAAFYASPFPRATVLTLDGVGEYETMTVSRADASGLEKLFAQDLPHSLGLLYSAFTAFLGFKVNSGEYKVMGMAGFGTPTQLDKVRSLYRLTPEGGFEILPGCFEFLCPDDVSYTGEFLKLFGPPRTPESPFRLAEPGATPAPGSIEAVSRGYADIAASLQACVEEIVAHLALGAVKRTGIPELCMAGGVGLNAVANGKLARMLPGGFYVQPASDDAGCALGAALFCHHAGGGRRVAPLAEVGLGKAYSQEETLALLADQGIEGFRVFEDAQALIEALAERLAEGKVAGWMQGRFEWGPRALGHRSILANPGLPGMKDAVNLKIKYREPFRPFAPSVLAEHAMDYFDLPGSSLAAYSPEHFMVSVAPVRPERQAAIPAVTHADGTARVHLVEREANPLYAGLIEAFFRRTGIPMLLNTSFNLRGEPIVSSPFDALQTFYSCDMDCLAIGNILVTKDS